MKRIAVVVLIFIFIAPLFAETSAEKRRDIEQAIRSKGASWQAADNWVTALSKEEFERLCGAPLSQKSPRSKDQFSIPLATDLPAAFDWRDNNGNWVTPPRDQSICGSCVIFTAVAQTEALLKIKRNDPLSDVDLSEQFLISSIEGSCENGWNRGQVFNFMRDVGTPTEFCFPYTANDTIPAAFACDNWQQQAVKIPGWAYISKEEIDIDLIKSAVYRHPVSVFMDVYADFSYYSGGVYEHVWGESIGGHGVLLVGWNDDEQSWICKNSWGADWGNDGFFRIKWKEGNLGTNMIFIWNEQANGSSLAVTPGDLDISLKADNSVEKNLVLKNNNTDDVEFAAMDYSVPIAFHPSEFNAYDEKSWWCGDPEIGGYNNHWLQYLDTPVIDLSSTTSPKLHWRGFWAIEGTAGAETPWDGWDGCNVWVSTDSGKTFEVMQPQFPDYNSSSMWSFGHDEQGWDMGTGIPGWGGKSNGWVQVEVDLTPFRSKHTVIRFAFASDLAFCSRDDSSVTGLFVDEIRVKDGDRSLFYDPGEDFEQMRVSGFGEEESPWLEFTDRTSGVVAANSESILPFRINSAQLSKGKYEAMIEIVSNVGSAPAVEIPIFLTVGDMVSLHTEPLTLLDDWRLKQNYPNPFNPITTIEYKVAKPSEVVIRVFNLVGKEVATLVDAFQNSGIYSIQWDGRDDAGIRLSSGLYIYAMTAGSYTQSKKMIMVK